MHEIEDFKQEERELSEMLLKLFQRWKSHVCGYLYDREKRQMNLVDEFCQDVRKGLQDLQCQDSVRTKMTKTNLNNEQTLGIDKPEKRLGNFVLGECFADIKCRHGHKTRFFNMSRGHYVACDECRTYILVGSNLMSCWRHENKDIWQANYDSVKDYDFIE